MAIFGRKIPSKVMVGGAEAKAAEPAPIMPSRKEKLMETKVDNKNTLLQDSPPPRRFTPEETPAGAVAAPSPRPGAVAGETVISGDTMVEGKITAKAELRIDGIFKGDIVSESRVFVGTAGKMEGTVEAKAMIVSGRVVGNLKVSERLELQSTGELFGDLETQPGALIIEKGARLEGRCSMGLKKEKTASSAGHIAGPPQAPRPENK